MLKLRNRRGAMLVLGALLFMALMVMAVLAVDFSRTVEQSAAIHTAADAGAHAGAVQMISPPGAPLDTAVAVAQSNMPPGAPTPTAEYGRWDDTARTFTPTDSVEANAVRVRTQRNTKYLIGGLFNILPATMRRTSVAWASAPVIAAPCVRPWALPYDSLLAKLGITDPNHQLTAGDLTLLQSLPISARRITLKLAAPGGTIPGNFQAIVMPSFWMAATGTYRVPPPSTGASSYTHNISTDNCPDLVGVGDSILTEPGNMTNPTITGTDALCAQFGGGFVGDDCINANGTVGVPIKVVLYGVELLQGRDPFVVKAIGGFVLERMYHNPCPTCSPPEGKSEISGYYDVFLSTGQVAGGGNTTVVRPILVQ